MKIRKRKIGNRALKAFLQNYKCSDTVLLTSFFLRLYRSTGGSGPGSGPWYSYLLARLCEQDAALNELTKV